MNVRYEIDCLYKELIVQNSWTWEELDAARKYFEEEQLSNFIRRIEQSDEYQNKASFEQKLKDKAGRESSYDLLWAKTYEALVVGRDHIRHEREKREIENAVQKARQELRLFDLWTIRPLIVALITSFTCAFCVLAFGSHIFIFPLFGSTIVVVVLLRATISLSEKMVNEVRYEEEVKKGWHGDLSKERLSEN